jgi:hypothetical protein
MSEQQPSSVLVKVKIKLKDEIIVINYKTRLFCGVKRGTNKCEWNFFYTRDDEHRGRKEYNLRPHLRHCLFFCSCRRARSSYRCH